MGIIRNRKFLLFSLISFMIWIVFAQFGLAIPLRGEEVLQNSSMVALVWTIMSFNVIVFQTNINRIILNKVNSFISLALGVLFIGLAIGLIGLANNFAAFIVISVVFAMGEMLFMPTIDSITGKLASPELLAAYFSIANLSAGLGSAVGNYLGGRLLEGYGVIGTATPWIIYSSSGITTAVVVFFVGRMIGRLEQG